MQKKPNAKKQKIGKGKQNEYENQKEYVKNGIKFF